LVVSSSTTGLSLLSAGILRQNRDMAKVVRKQTTRRNGSARGERVSELGRVLQKLADKYEASGGKLLNRRELEREIAERRGLR